MLICNCEFKPVRQNSFYTKLKGMGVKYEGAGKNTLPKPSCLHPKTLLLGFVVCSTFILVYLSLISVFIFLPSSVPFPHSTLLLWQMYSLQDNKGLIGKSGLAFRMACLKEPERVCDGIAHRMYSLKGRADFLRTAAYPSILYQSPCERTNVFYTIRFEEIPRKSACRANIELFRDW